MAAARDSRPGAIQRAFEAAGVEFMNGGQPGVRLKGRMKLSENKPVVDPRDIADQAARFLAADERLRDPRLFTPSTMSVLLIPSNVNSALACELFLKCILIIDGEKPPPTHDLLKLYRRLRPKRRCRIKEMWATSDLKRDGLFQRLEESAGGVIPRDLESLLTLSRDAFTQLRYVYEARMDQVTYLVADLPRILHDVVLEIKPEWQLPR